LVFWVIDGNFLLGSISEINIPFLKRKGGNMRKQRIEYDSPVDALVAIAKRLSVYEGRYGMTSEEFFNRFSKGESEDSEELIEWANDYQHFIAIRREIEEQIRHAA